MIAAGFIGLLGEAALELAPISTYPLACSTADHMTAVFDASGCKTGFCSWLFDPQCGTRCSSQCTNNLNGLTQGPFLAALGFLATLLADYVAQSFSSSQASGMCRERL